LRDKRDSGPQGPFFIFGSGSRDVGLIRQRSQQLEDAEETSIKIERIADKKGCIVIWAYDWDLSVNPAGTMSRKVLSYEHSRFSPMPQLSNRARPSAGRTGGCWRYRCVQ
jgi:hypothetical protein